MARVVPLHRLLLCSTELDCSVMSSAHVQELRGHYVRRLPTPEEIAARSPIVLTERDRQVLVAVHQHGFLTTDLVELAFFPPRRGSRSSAARGYAETSLEHSLSSGNLVGCREGLILDIGVYGQ